MDSGIVVGIFGLVVFYLMVARATIHVISKEAPKDAWYYKSLIIFCFFFWPIPLMLCTIHVLFLDPFVGLLKTLRGE
jgi:hypothetical protein